tara:strand:+ start:389 stop:1471 length:1083 start_codon:yes stop_codon:yes gene_type:complete
VANQYKLIVIFGGQSAEHDVSCISARHVIAAADSERYEILPIGIDKDGNWSYAEAAASARLSGKLPKKLDPIGPVWNPFSELEKMSERNRTIVFPLLHGPLGEDGTIQGLLEILNVPYVGSGVLGSSLAMNKLAAKEVLSSHGIPQVNYRGLHVNELGLPGSEGRIALLESLFTNLGPLMFVKPANLGSSVGVTNANDLESLETALEVAASYDEYLVVEKAIVGREIELAVLGDLTPQVSGPGEIRPSGNFYDYTEKYESQSAELIEEPDLEPSITIKFQELAAKAFLALRCSGMARVDFFLDPSLGPILNEVNTIPGFTPISMYPRLWRKAGLSYSALVDRLVDIALERHARQRRKTSL